MKIAFLTETQFRGKWPINFPNTRTEIAWQLTLDADHYHIRDWNCVSGYDYVFLILPKGGVYLNSEGKTLTDDKNVFSELFSSTIISDLKRTNRKICSMQEGPVWYVNDLTLEDQFNFYNLLSECDILFSHNDVDQKWYKGLFPTKQVETMPSLMLTHLIDHIVPSREDKILIGGNFSRWYGGFQSYVVANELNLPMYVQTSHSSRVGEEHIPNLTVLPRLSWLDWMKTLSTFKLAIHLMPTVAAGTFSLNCAYFGIPCIGNQRMDTQRLCFPDTSVDVEDVEKSRNIAVQLISDVDFYQEVCEKAKENFEKHFSVNIYKQRMKNILK